MYKMYNVYFKIKTNWSLCTQLLFLRWHIMCEYFMLRQVLSCVLYDETKSCHVAFMISYTPQRMSQNKGMTRYLILYKRVSFSNTSFLKNMTCKLYKRYCLESIHSEECHNTMAKYYGVKYNGKFYFYLIIFIII